MEIIIDRDAQTWFEGEAEYKVSVSVLCFKIAQINIHRYYKDGNTISRIYLKKVGRLVAISNEKEKKTTMMLDNEIVSEKISEEESVSVDKIDKNLEEINGHKCTKVVYNKKGSKSVTWIDESYTIPWLKGKVAEVPQGLVVKSITSVKTSKIKLSFKMKLTTIKTTVTSDSKSKL